MNGTHRAPAWALTATLLLTACADDGTERSVAIPAATEASVALRWAQTAVEAVRTSGLAPTAIARALAVVHTCMYDAWAAYDAVAVPSHDGGPNRRPPAERTMENQAAAVSHAAYTGLSDVLPGARTERYDPLLRELGLDRLAAYDSSSPAGVGAAACGRVLDRAHRDGANQLGDHPRGKPGIPYSDWTAYSPVNPPLDLRPGARVGGAVYPGRWRPLVFLGADARPVIQTFLTPQWARIQPFALSSPSALRPRGPVRPGTPEYRAQARELLDLSANLTEEQKVAVRYWAAGPRNEFAAGQWSAFAAHVSARDAHGASADGLARDVQMFFVVSNAIADAAIACWDAKVHFDSVRPVDAIRTLFADEKVRAWAGPGRGTDEIDGSAWHPYHPPTLPSPPFGEYPAAHSVLGSAGAEVMRLFTGSDRLEFSAVIPAGTSGYEPGVPSADLTLSWATFTSAAIQEGQSRLWAGVHFRRADVDGQALGRAVAAQVWAKATRLFRGERD